MYHVTEAHRVFEASRSCSHPSLQFIEDLRSAELALGGCLALTLWERNLGSACLERSFIFASLECVLAQ